MKTTVEISEYLLEAAKRVAAREGITLRELIETALRQVVNDRRKPGHFKLRRPALEERVFSRSYREHPGIEFVKWLMRAAGHDRRRYERSGVCAP